MKIRSFLLLFIAIFFGTTALRAAEESESSESTKTSAFINDCKIATQTAVNATKKILHETVTKSIIRPIVNPLKQLLSDNINKPFSTIKNTTNLLMQYKLAHFLYNYFLKCTEFTYFLVIQDTFIQPQLSDLQGNLLTFKRLPIEFQRMAEKIGLDPAHIVIVQSNQLSPGAFTSFKNKWMLLNPDFLKSLPKDQLRFLIGHELVHLKNNDTKKRLLNLFAVPLVTHCGLILLHKLNKKCINVIEKYFNLKDNKILTCSKKVSHFLAYSAIPRLVLIPFIILQLEKLNEIIADITSATEFNCAQGGVDFFRDQEKYGTLSLDPLMKKIRAIILKFIDEHPSHEERIAYLSEIAKEQQVAA